MSPHEKSEAIRIARKVLWDMGGLYLVAAPGGKGMAAAPAGNEEVADAYNRLAGLQLS